MNEQSPPCYPRQIEKIKQLTAMGASLKPNEYFVSKYDLYNVIFGDPFILSKKRF